MQTGDSAILITIDDPATEAAVARLAARKGVSPDQAIKIAVENEITAFAAEQTP